MPPELDREVGAVVGADALLLDEERGDGFLGGVGDDTGALIVGFESYCAVAVTCATDVRSRPTGRWRLSDRVGAGVYKELVRLAATEDCTEAARRDSDREVSTVVRPDALLGDCQRRLFRSLCGGAPGQGG
jgi:hypothetical protein